MEAKSHPDPANPNLANSDLDTLAINTLRVLALDAVHAAGEGHPGAPLGLAPLAYVLWTRALRFHPQNPQWRNRDRVVLSAGHASMLLYGALHLTGYDLSLEDLRQFRQWNSRTPGHPEYGHTPGVETTTGPLGQGFANAVGMALAEAHLAARFNREGFPIIDHFTYAICSDGDLQEGISHEAASLAGHLGLGKLIVFYDDNDVQLDGPTNWAFSEQVSGRFEAYGWHVQTVQDGNNDLLGIETAIQNAQAETARPSLIRLRTTIGYGLPKAGTSEVHGKAPSSDDVRKAKEYLGYPSPEPFQLETTGQQPWLTAGLRGFQLETDWNSQFERYRLAHPEVAHELEMIWQGRFADGWNDALPSYEPGNKDLRTRNASHNALKVLGTHIPQLIGGSADLESSNMTGFAAHIAKNAFEGRNIHFGVREHAMVAIASGLALSDLQPFVATFLTFSDYAKNAIRLAALMRLPVVYVFSHDSIGLGTDGPTHQPIEHLAGLRAIPNLHVLRPADANETNSAWRLALERRDGPTVIALTRQDVPILPAKRQGAARGGYVVAGGEGEAEIVLIATGSEVALALKAREVLEQTHNLRTRVVSLLSWEQFGKQPRQYRDAILPPGVRARVAIEAASPFGWERWVGELGRIIGLERFGGSAPEGVLMNELGFNVDHVVRTALEVLETCRSVQH